MLVDQNVTCPLEVARTVMGAQGFDVPNDWRIREPNLEPGRPISEALLKEALTTPALVLHSSSAPIIIERFDAGLYGIEPGAVTITPSPKHSVAALVITVGAHSEPVRPHVDALAWRWSHQRSALCVTVP
jgi:hypothetical protein